MADFHSLLIVFLFLLLSSSLPPSTTAQETIRSPEELDLLIRDYTFKSLGRQRRIKTGEIYNVDLPANLSDGGGITANAARYRCGSLRRYGARFDGVSLEPGVNVQPCFLRVMVITQSLDLNWSSALYSSNYELSGYRLVSPIVGLTVYNYNSSSYSDNPFEVAIRSSLVTVSFARAATDQTDPLCAMFEKNGTVSLKTPMFGRVCESTSDGHYGLVVKQVPPPAAPPGAAGGGRGGGVSTTLKVALGVVGGVGVVVATAMVVWWCVVVRKKRRIAEMERRGYEEEDMRFAVVGNVRTPVASSTRTLPRLENEFVTRNDPSSSRD